MSFAQKFLVGLVTSILLVVPLLAQDVPAKAERHMIRGEAALEMKRIPDAVKEFKKATELAPGWANAWYNLGVAQVAADDLSGAIRSYRRYLKLKPDAKDKKEVESKIIKLEFRLEILQKTKRSKQNARAQFLRGLAGEWRRKARADITFFWVTTSGNSIIVRLAGDYRRGRRIVYKGLTGQIWVGKITGSSISGRYTRRNSVWYDNGKDYTRNFTGTIGKDGRSMTLTYEDVYVGDTRGRRALNYYTSQVTSNFVKSTR